MLAFVYAFSMSMYRETEHWPQLYCHRICSYHDDFLEASWEVTRLINEDETDYDECFAVGAIPLCNDHHCWY